MTLISPYAGKRRLNPTLHSISARMRKEIVLRVHWPDHLEYGRGEARLDSREKLAAAIGYWRERFGVRRFYWRVDHWFIQRYCVERKDDREVSEGWSRFWKTLAASQIQKVCDFVDVTRAAGAKAYLYLPFLDEGLPRDLLYRPRGTPYPYQSRFSEAHPEFVEVDRSGRERHWGVLCYSYPEVRRYRLGMLRDLLAEAPADGLHLCTRSYVLPAAYGDQFGFNPPVVEEYRRRHGVDILHSDFDMDSWRRLRGEALSRFLSEVKALLRPAGRRLSLAVPRGDCLGPPYGNLHLDWRNWIRDGLVDELVVNVISGRQLTEGHSGYGFLCNGEDGIGLNPLDQDLVRVYGPVCRRAGRRLFLGAGVDLNRREPDGVQLEGLARLAGFDGFVFTTGNLGERFSFDKRGRPIDWTIEELDLGG